VNEFLLQPEGEVMEDIINYYKIDHESNLVLLKTKTFNGPVNTVYTDTKEWDVLVIVTRPPDNSWTLHTSNETENDHLGYGKYLIYTLDGRVIPIKLEAEDGQIKEVKVIPMTRTILKRLIKEKVKHALDQINIGRTFIRRGEEGLREVLEKELL
jgi:hypothetical protein